MLHERRPIGIAGSDAISTSPRSARWTGRLAWAVQILAALFLLAAAGATTLVLIVSFVFIAWRRLPELNLGLLADLARDR